MGEISKGLLGISLVQAQYKSVTFEAKENNKVMNRVEFSLSLKRNITFNWNKFRMSICKYSFSKGFIGRILLIMALSGKGIIAQTRIEGTARDTDQNLLPAVNITVTKEGKLLAFAVTKTDGSYHLKVNAQVDSVLIAVSKMGYTNQEFLLPNKNQRLDFVLQKGDFTLKEVKVELPPIRRRGDTLSYKIEEFQSVADRTIGDVIKKLPGINVDADGIIYYQGNPINRYYVEDMNLLDGRYGLVNENLPHGKVAIVQVYENHQPIRALDSLRPSDRAAINIKLKNKVTKTGNFQYGAGFQPFLWNVNATPIVFVPNFQFLTSVKSNNTGENLFPQFYDNFQNGLFAKENWLSVSSVSPPGFSPKRWMDNRSHALSLNTLKKSTRSLEMKLNVSLVLDQQRRSGNSTTTYFLEGEPVHFAEDILSRFKTNHLSGALEFIKNVPHAYFNNKLTFEKEWRADEAQNARFTRIYNQENSTGNFRISNNFHRIFNLRHTTYNFYSLISYVQNTQDLSVKLTDSLANPQQVFSHRGFNTHHFADFSVRIKKRFSIALRTGSQIALSHIHTKLSGHEVKTNTVNNFQWNTFKTYISAGMTFTPGKWWLNLNFPFAHYYIDYSPEERRRTFSRLVPEPMLNARLKSVPGLEFTGNIRYSNLLAQLGDIHTGSIMQNYLTVVSKNTDFTDDRRLSGGVGVNYNNAVSGLSFNLNLNASRGIQNRLPQNYILPDGSTEVQYMAKRNLSHTQSGKVQLTQYLFGLKTSLSAGLLVMKFQNEQWVNGYPGSFTNRTIEPNAHLKVNRFKQVELTYSTRYTHVKGSNQPESIRQFQQQMGMALAVVKNTVFIANAEHHSINAQDYFFSDLTVRYTVPKIKQDFELGVVNLFNQNTFKSIYLNNYIMQETIFRLRPRQFLLRGSFRL